MDVKGRPLDVIGRVKIDKGLWRQVSNGVPEVLTKDGDVRESLEQLVGCPHVFDEGVYGHKVLALMVVGIIVTYLMSPKLALASGLAFGLGEGLEWVIFTTTKKTFRQRVLWSAIPAVVVDTAVFLVVAGFFTWANFGFETITKMLALAWISFIPDPLGETK